MQVYLIVVALLTCLSGVGAFALLWPRDASRARAFRSWPLTLLLLGVAAPAIISVPIFKAEFLSDNGYGLLRTSFYAACVMSIGLMVVALVGDRLTNGGARRRCPKCWYDMGATPGLMCPECGHEARRERSLFRSRRRGVLLLAALIPAAAALVPWNAIHYRGPEWARQLSNTAFVVLYPFMQGNTTYVKEVDDSLPGFGERPREFSGWQRGVLTHFARRNQEDTNSPLRALTACKTLIALEADDRATVGTLTFFAAPSRPANHLAIKMLGSVRTDLPAAKAALLAALNGADLNASYYAAIALSELMPRAPGGPAPAALFGTSGVGMVMSPELVALLLRWFDPSEQSRAALMARLDTPRAKSVALVSLAALWPDDRELRAKLLEAVRFDPDAGTDGESVRTLYSLLFDEMRRCDDVGEPRVPAERLGLYTPELCDELEKWLPMLDANDALTPRPPERMFGKTLRSILEDARALHAGRS